ncbi:unnamed protein product [Timema podura]|uniref:Uncharacterized protein n=1 Tax=Timema podura TaxID=61482 RepID=A0ABN7PK94_TIMPD|nr:unnamed protein product [Timema podura]
MRMGPPRRLFVPRGRSQASRATWSRTRTDLNRLGVGAEGRGEGVVPLEGKNRPGRRDGICHRPFWYRTF